MKYLNISPLSKNVKFKRNKYLKLKNKGYIIAYCEHTKFYISVEDEYLLRFRYFNINSKQYPYLRCKIGEKRYMLHNLILQPPEGYIVDHINGNIFDNRRENLRLVTKQQNCMNRKTNKGVAHKGISYIQSNSYRPYVARIYVNGNKIHLGSFATLEEAINIREEAEIKYFGEYRREG